MTADSRPARRLLLGLLLAAIALHLAYVGWRPLADPTAAHPALDGAYYLSWAGALADGRPGPEGAYYLAPLFPLVLAVFVRLFGDNLVLLYAGQHLLSLATAILILRGGRKLVGSRAAMIAGVLFLLYHPLVFFASRPLGEPLALLFLFSSLMLAPTRSLRGALGAGLLAGIAALGRPNLILVPLFWSLGELLGARYKRAGLLVVGLGLALLPVTVRNYVVSGHLVLISSNSGITAYHGNGPEARGVYTPPPGFSREVAAQRDEATALARIRSGRELDPIEADRWWGRQAVRARLSDPAGSIALLLRRVLLLLDNFEHGLAAHPMLDTHPWRPTWHAPHGRELALVPFALLLGLTAAALVLEWPRPPGGAWTWSAILACALTPLLFYMSSRYRLPAAALLVLPAARGVVGLVAPGRAAIARRRGWAAAAGVAALGASLFLSSVDLFGLAAIRRVGLAGGLTNRAVAHKRSGDLQAAERDARAAVSLAPESGPARYNLGVIVEARGARDEAEQRYREALEVSRYGLAEAAANLARILIDRGAANESIPLLNRALETRPTQAICWNNLIVALMLTGQPAQARDAVRRATELGVALEPELVSLVRGAADPGTEDGR